MSASFPRPLFIVQQGRTISGFGVMDGSFVRIQQLHSQKTTDAAFPSFLQQSINHNLQEHPIPIRECQAT